MRFMRLGASRRLRIVARVPLPKTTQPPARIQIQAIEPIVDCGRYAVKRTVGDRVDVYATVFKDGHDTLGGRGARARARRAELARGAAARRSATTAGAGRSPSTARAAGSSPSPRGPIASRRGRRRSAARSAPGETELAGELSEGAVLLGRRSVTVEEGLAAEAGDRARRRHLVAARGRRRPRARALRLLVRALPALVGRLPRRRGGAAAARASSASTSSTCRRSIRSGTRTARGRTTRSTPGRATRARRGRSARRRAATTRSIPDLGTWDDFDAMVAAAKAAGIELALDFAIQCSPDHPWLKRASRSGSTAAPTGR